MGGHLPEGQVTKWLDGVALRRNFHREACAFRRRRNGGGERVWWRAPWCGGSLKTDDTLDVRDAAAAFPAAKPLLRRAASAEQHEPASGVGFPTPTHPGPRAGRPSKRGQHGREAGRGGRKERAPHHLSEPPGFIPGGLVLVGGYPQTKTTRQADARGLATGANREALARRFVRGLGPRAEWRTSAGCDCE